MDTAADTISYTCTSSPLVLSNAHIHGPAGPNAEGPPMHAINFPLPTTAVFFYAPEDEAFIVAGRTYTNLHTAAFPLGEIRCQNLLTARVYCMGDGTATTCPCSNPGSHGEGCANTASHGAILSPFGSTQVATDDMAFIGNQLLPGKPALLFNGTASANGGNGTPFGGGLLCAGGMIQRMGVRIPDGTGSAQWGPGLAGTGGWAVGERRFLQIWYRDPANVPCGAGFNTSNGLDVTFD
jgi:hypothetical protein